MSGTPVGATSADGVSTPHTTPANPPPPTMIVGTDRLFVLVVSWPPPPLAAHADVTAIDPTSTSEQALARIKRPLRAMMLTLFPLSCRIGLGPTGMPA